MRPWLAAQCGRLWGLIQPSPPDRGTLIFAIANALAACFCHLQNVDPDQWSGEQRVVDELSLNPKKAVISMAPLKPKKLLLTALVVGLGLSGSLDWTPTEGTLVVVWQRGS